MKATTLATRLNTIYTGSKSTIAYRIACDLVAGTNKTYTMRGDGIIRPCYTSGSGRFTSNQDHTAETCALLDLLRVKYMTGNDAPKGGATGNFIKITSKIAR